MWTLMTAPLVVSLALCIWRSRTLHYIGLISLYVVMLLHYGAAQIN
jgi:hypothetical protein